MQYGYYPNSYFQQYQPQSMQAQTSQPPVSTMGGFIPVQNENEARMYRLAPGMSATFIDENAPYCYTKTEGVSQLDRPIFKRFRLVEELDSSQTVKNGSQTASQNGGIDLSAYVQKADIQAIEARIEALERMVKHEQSPDAKQAYTATADKPTASSIAD